MAEKKFGHFFYHLKIKYPCSCQHIEQLIFSNNYKVLKLLWNFVLKIS